MNRISGFMNLLYTSPWGFMEQLVGATKIAMSDRVFQKGRNKQGKEKKKED
jgi:hypothetical protein